MSGVMSRQWWKEAVVYQIYPASFLDTNGDGWGDVRGITSKLDYLKSLGVDVIWVSPIYKSPQIDMGYDISDYRDIDSKYGTLSDVDSLIKELKSRDMGLMMDLVVNHTSNQHDWFLESSSSRDNPRRNWYIWKDPKRDEHGNPLPPNNWLQLLADARSAWTYHEPTDQYYLSLFSPEQPDLNWEEPDVRAAVHDVMRFWFDRGVCGFRMDVINLISKVQTFPDGEFPDPNTQDKYAPGWKYFANGPRLHEFLKEMNCEVLSKYRVFTVGEMPFVDDEEEILKIVGASSGELNMIFIFELVEIDREPGAYEWGLYDWDRIKIKQCMNRWQRLMIDRDGWNSLFCENHDQSRSVSRYTDDSDQYRELGAKLLCLMQTTLAGTLYVFQGEELGMRNIPLSWDPEEYKDIASQAYYKKMKDRYPNDESKLELARKVLRSQARDNGRTPMQWDSSPNAGFCTANVKPWMRVNDDWETVNAEIQVRNSDETHLSVFHFWKRQLKFRSEHKDVFVYGDFQLVDEKHPKLFAYKRVSIGEAWFVQLNFSGDEVTWEIPAEVRITRWVYGNYTSGTPGKPTDGKITIMPWEGLIAQCEP